MTIKIGPLNLKSVMEKGDVKEGLTIMMEVGRKADIGQTVETDSENQFIYM